MLRWSLAAIVVFGAVRVFSQNTLEAPSSRFSDSLAKRSAEEPSLEMLASAESFDLPAMRLQDIQKAASAPQRIRGVAVPGAVERGIPPGPGDFRLNDEEARWVADRIFENECSGKDECLTSWNRSEDFASMGIGHLLWYRKGYVGTFTESFPELLRFLEANGVGLPAWLRGGPPCPWRNHDEFERDMQSERMVELRDLLIRTKGLQARFVADRGEAALPKILQTIDDPRVRESVRFQFFRVARAKPVGVYAIVDYIDFKGEGINPEERYAGRGWGLRQVLAGMQGRDEGGAALAEFADSARIVLERRIRNSPPARHEAQWREGWFRRIDSYRGFSQQS